MNLKHLSLAERQNYENMTVVPILSDTNTPFDVLDLKEGLKMGLVKICLLYTSPSPRDA